MNNAIITLISNKKKIDDMILRVDSYNVLLMYIEQLEDQEVIKKYETIVFNSMESIYHLCKQQLEISYNTNNIAKSIVDDFVEKIFDAIDNLDCKIIYKNQLREAC